MTSGNFQSIPIDEVWVNRETRQRSELKDIPELAQSLQRTGLINPITVKADGELVAGERRWTAAKSLGWTHITVQRLEDLDELQLQLLELEENTRRAELPWQDQCAAVAKYDALRRQSNPEWTQIETSKALGISQSDASIKIQVAKELEAGNERVAEAPRFTVARGIVERNNERQRTSKIEAITAAQKGEAKEVPLLNVDFKEWAKTYDGAKFNFIHCDFPYGVKADKHAQGAASSFGGYDDSETVYWDLLDTLYRSMDRVVADSAHLMFWFAMDYYAVTVEALTNMGWIVQPHPLIWHKSDNMGILPDPKRGPRRIYETCLMASRGDRQIIRAVSNVQSHPTTKTIHMSEKPVGMLTKFMEMFVDEYSIVLDPTCGSANAIRAAESRGAAKVLGLEINSEFYGLAKAAYNSGGDLD